MNINLILQLILQFFGLEIERRAEKMNEKKEQRDAEKRSQKELSKVIERSRINESHVSDLSENWVQSTVEQLQSSEESNPAAFEKPSQQNQLEFRKNQRQSK